MKNYISKSLFFILVLCINTSWSVTRMMVCLPDYRLIKEYNFVKDHDKKRSIITPEDPYTITIKYDTNKLEKERIKEAPKISDVVTVKFSLISWKDGFFNTFAKVRKINEETRNLNGSFDDSRLASLFGTISYTDSIRTGILRKAYDYKWQLYTNYVDESRVKHDFRNPYTNAPLSQGQYLLRDFHWVERGSPESAGILPIKRESEDGSVRQIREVHFLPGLHTCSQWTTNQADLATFVRDNKAAILNAQESAAVTMHVSRDGEDGERKVPHPSDQSSRHINTTIDVSANHDFQGFYREYKCDIPEMGNPEGNTEFRWGIEFIPKVNQQYEYKILSNIMRVLEPPQVHYDNKTNTIVVSNITFQFKRPRDGIIHLYRYNFFMPKQSKQDLEWLEKYRAYMQKGGESYIIPQYKVAYTEFINDKDVKRLDPIYTCIESNKFELKEYSKYTYP